MTIPALPSLDRTSPTFRSDLDAFFLTQLPNTVTALNSELTRIDGILPKGFTGTSEASRTIASSGSFTFGVVSGTTRAFAVGQRLVIAAASAPSSQMRGYVTAYTPGTGELVVAVDESSGSGTFDLWSIAVTAPSASPHYVGDVVLTNRALSAPSWLPADGAIYSQSSYAALYAELGLLRDGVVRNASTYVAVGAGGIQAQYSAPNPGTPRYPLFTVASGFRAYGKTTGASSHKLARSADGSIWEVASLPNTTNDNPYAGFAAIGTTIIGIPPSGDAWVARSTDDGASWTTAAVIPSGSQAPFVLGGLFVVLTGTTTYYTSPDGILWASRTAPAVLYQRGIFNGVCFAAIAANPSTTVYTSTDAITWTSRTVPSINLGMVRSVGSALLLFPHFYSSGSAAYLRSTDGGATWTSHTTAAGPGYEYVTSAEELDGVLYVESNFNGSSAHGTIYKTTDGISWSAEHVCASGTGYAYLSKTSAEIVYRVDASPYPKYVRQGGAWIYAGDSSDDRYLQGQLEVEYSGVLIRPGGTASPIIRRKSVYTYNSATQFAVPQVQAAPDVTAYIKT